MKKRAETIFFGTLYVATLWTICRFVECLNSTMTIGSLIIVAFATQILTTIYIIGIACRHDRNQKEEQQKRIKEKVGEKDFDGISLRIDDQKFLMDKKTAMHLMQNLKSVLEDENKKEAETEKHEPENAGS